MRKLENMTAGLQEGRIIENWKW